MIKKNLNERSMAKKQKKIASFRPLELWSSTGKDD